MELTSLKFSVETKELDAAIKKIEELGVAVKNFNTIQTASSKVNKTQAQEAKALAQAQEAQAKAALAQAKAAKAATEATDAQTNSTNKQERAAKASVSVLERQQTILEFMTQGFSRGQASTLAMAKAAGTLTDDLRVLGDVLQTQRKLIGGDPFDKSTSGLLALNNQYTELKESMRQFNAESGLTAKQAKELARDKERIIERMKVEGASFTDIKNKIREHNAEYIAAGKAVNTLVDAEKELVRQHRESANAVRAVAKEEEKMLNIMENLGAAQASGSSFSQKAAAAEAVYARNLKLSGVSAEDSAKKLAVYRTQLQAVAKEEEQRQVKFLQRGLQPQIGDVVVSLAGGQNPLTVMLQQGDQIRGLIAQTGVQGEALRKAMAGAMSGTVDSIKMTAGAMVSLLGGAITSVGKSMVGLVTGPFTAMNTALKASAEGGRNASNIFAAMGAGATAFNQALTPLLPLITGGLIVALGVLALTLYKVTKQEDELNQVLINQGGALGMNRDSVVQYTESLKGISSAKAEDALIALAKEGGIFRAEAEKIVPVMVDMQKYLGIALKDSAKAFGDLKDDPLKALYKLAEATGQVNTGLLVQVQELINIGDKTSAVALAGQEWARVNKTSVDSMKTELSSLGTVLNSISDAYDLIITKLRKAVRGDTLTEVLVKDIAAAESKLSALKIGSLGMATGAIAAQQAVVDSLKLQLELLEKQNKAKSEAAAENQVAVGAMKRLSEEAAKAISPLEKLKNQTQQIQRDLDAVAKAKGLGSPEYLSAVANATVLTAKLDEEYKKILEKKNKLTDAEKKEISEKERLAKLAETMQLNFAKLANAQVASQDELTKAQQKYLDVIAHPDYDKFDAKTKQAISDSFLLAQAKEEVTLAAEKERKIQNAIYEDYTKLQAARDKAVFDAMDNSEKLDQAMREEATTIALQATLIGKTDAERKKAIKTRQAEVILAKEIADIDKLDATNNKGAIDQMRIDAYRRFQQAANNINTEIAVDAAEKFYSEFIKIRDGLSDVIMTALFEGGKAGSKKLKDLLIEQLKKPIKIVLDVVVNTLMGSAIGSVTSMLGLSGSSGSASGSIGGLSTGISGLDIMNKTGIAGMGSFGMGANAGFSALFGEAGLSGAMSAGTTAIGAGNIMGGLGTFAGALGPIALGIGAVVALAKSLDKSGTMHMGGSAVTSAAGGTQAGLGVGGVGADQRFGGSVSKEAQAFTAGLSKSIVDILDSTAIAFGKTAGYEAAVGFADDTSKDGAWGALVIKKLGDAVSGFGQTAGSDKWPGQTFSDGEQGVKDFTAAVAANVKSTLEAIGLPDWAKSMMAKIGDAPSLEELAAVVDTINGTQKALASLGQAMPMFANLTGEAVTKLLSAFGGVQGLASAASSYFEKFYTEQEKTKIATDSLTKSFADLGLSVPTDRLKYRAEVEKAMAAGNEELVAKLLMLGDSFAALNPWLDTTTGGVDAISETLKSLQEESANLNIELLKAQGNTAAADAALRDLSTKGMTALEISVWDANRALEQQIKDINTKNGLEKQILTLQGNTAALRALELASLSPANQELQKLIWSLEETTKASNEAATAAANYASQQASITANLDTQLLQLQGKTEELRARELATLSDINKAKQQEIWNLQDGKTAADAAAAANKKVEDEAYNLETRRLQLLGDTAKLRERELALISEANRPRQQEIWAIEDQQAAQAAAAKAAEEAARAQQQAADEAARAAEAIRNAWQSVTDSIFDEVRRIRGLTDQGSANNLATAMSNFQTANTKALGGDQEAAKSLPELSKILLDLAGMQATSLVDLQRIQLLTALQLEQTGVKLAGQYGLSIPAYADGGHYQGGMALVGEQGPELINFNSAGRVYNASATSSMLGSDRLETLVEKLNENLEGLRYEVRADVGHNAKTAKLLDRVIKDGETVSVSFDKAQPVTVV